MIDYDENEMKWINKGISLMAGGSEEDAIKCFDEALKLDNTSPQALTEKGRILTRQGKYIEAIRCFDELIKVYPYVSMGWQNKGMTLFEMGRYNDAIVCFDECLKLDDTPDEHKTWNDKGVAYYNLKDYDKALVCFDEAVKLDKKFVDAWLNRMLTLYVLGRYDEAADSFNQAKLLGWTPNK